MKTPVWSKTLKSKALDFFLEPAATTPLAALRTGLGLCLLVQAYFLRFSAFDFLSSTGFIQGDLARLLNNPVLPQISWLLPFLAPLHISEHTCILLVSSFYVLSLLAFTLNYKTRLATFLVWFLHWVLINTANSSAYGVDQYAHIFLFYLMWAPSGWADSPSSATRLVLRVMQLHLCISYLASGFDKAHGIQWWNGELLWRAMNLPVYRQFDMSWLVHWPVVSLLAGWMTLILEIGYCVFIWPKQTRKFWVMGMIGLHLGIVFFLGLHLFGIVMVILTATLFGLSPEHKVFKLAPLNIDDKS